MHIQEGINANTNNNNRAGSRGAFHHLGLIVAFGACSILFVVLLAQHLLQIVRFHAQAPVAVPVHPEVKEPHRLVIEAQMHHHRDVEMCRFLTQKLLEADYQKTCNQITNA